MKKILTLSVVAKDQRILLGYKKRGFGQGLWNGFGGKVQLGETLQQAALRELCEETGFSSAVIREKSLMTIDYQHTDTLCEIHIFETLEFDGEPHETEEMRPAWFALDTLPFGHMWPNDRHWLPLFIQGYIFEALFRFRNYEMMTSHSLTIL